jgi:ubiquinone biosynthesis protein COQ4
LNLSFALPRYDFPRARRALAALLRDPDDLPQVFALIESISGTAPHRLLLGFKRSQTGARILRERPDIAVLLSDRAWLKTLPEGSLGRAYLAFVESEGISAEGIREADGAAATDRRRPEVFIYMHRRMRDTHDLWHTVTGYKGDVLGELALLAFTLGQSWNAGLAVIVVAALLKGMGRGHAPVIRDGFRRGRAAAWLPAQDWESTLTLPLDEVRARLKLGSPPAYTPIRTPELRAQGLL